MTEWEDLIDRHLAGELSEPEMERLAELLDSNPEVRQQLISDASWNTELSEVLRTTGHTERKMDQTTFERHEHRRSQSIRTLRVLLSIAAAAILLLSVMLLRSRTDSGSQRANSANIRPAPIAKITGLSGALIWTGDRGQILNEITTGTQLAGGTIEGLSPDSWFELEFNDGSQVTISGASLLTFSDDGQKRLRLREGRMSADVNPQPADKPMLIQTRTAKLTVLGTSFDVEAALPATSVKVREGTVRVSRVSDGKKVDVPANHRIVAAADQEFERTQVAAVVRSWRSRIDQGPDETFGKWTAATESEPAYLKAVAFVPEEAPNVTLYLLGLGVRSDEGAPIQVNDRTVFTIRGQIDFETDIFLGIQVADAEGNYAGKFRCNCNVQTDATGDFVVQAPLSDFELDPSVAAFSEKLASSPDGLFITATWSFTYSAQPSGLQFESIELASDDRFDVDVPPAAN